MFGCQRRLFSKGRSPFELLHGIKPSLLLLEFGGCHHASDSFRETELLEALGTRAARANDQALQTK